MSQPAPKATFSLFEAIAATAGIVIGVGIFRFPSIVAGALESSPAILAAWVAGGIISAIGALCYAELAAAFPSPGGEYHFLSRLDSHCSAVPDEVWGLFEAVAPRCPNLRGVTLERMESTIVRDDVDVLRDELRRIRNFQVRTT